MTSTEVLLTSFYSHRLPSSFHFIPTLLTINSFHPHPSHTISTCTHPLNNINFFTYNEQVQPIIRKQWQIDHSATSVFQFSSSRNEFCLCRDIIDWAQVVSSRLEYFQHRKSKTARVTTTSMHTTYTACNLWSCDVITLVPNYQILAYLG